VGKLSRYVTKSDLVKVAGEELGMSLVDANAHPAPILKEKIRKARAMKNPSQDRLTIPKRFVKMRRTELRDEVHMRGLRVIPNATRVQMQMQIQEHVQKQMQTQEDADACIMESGTSTVDEDVEMIPEHRSKAEPSPKKQVSILECFGLESATRMAANRKRRREQEVPEVD